MPESKSRKLRLNKDNDELSCFKKEIEERIIYCYEKSMQKYLDDKHLIPEDSLYEISFNELETQPINSLAKMYSKLNISDFNKNKIHFLYYSYLLFSSLKIFNKINSCINSCT